MKTIFPQFLLFFFIMAIWHVHADNITVQGEISGQWAYDTVFIAGDVTVPDGESVMIQPGVRVIFEGAYEFRVEGSVRAVGWMNDSIYFTMADTTGFHIDTIAGGGWKGIRFDRNRLSNDSSLFSYCRFEYGKIVDADPVTGNGGALYVNNFGKIRINNSSFAHNFATYNGGAIFLDSASIIVRNCYFQDNRAGLSVAPWGYGGAICSDNSSPQIYWNTFEDNSSTGVGGGLAVRFKDCDVYNNIFLSNYSALGGGFGILHIPECTHRINTNLVAENASTFFGGGVANIDASPVYINNTIAFNQSAYGGGFYCKDSVSPDFFNTIFWGNMAAVGPQGYLFEVYSQADFFYCDVEGGPELFGGSGGGQAFIGAYEVCLDEHPQFEGSGEDPYAPGGESPCIGAGSADTTGFYLPPLDLAGNPRVSHGIIDIGAYERFITGMAGPENPGLWIRLWPNPATGQLNVQNTKLKGGIIRIDIMDMCGRVAAGPYRGNADEDTLELDISDLPAGLFFIRVFTGKGVVTENFVKIRP